MKTSQWIVGWLLALWLPCCLAIRLDVQTLHSVEEAAHHCQPPSGPVSAKMSQVNLTPSGESVQRTHVCHTCLLCAQRPTAADEPHGQWWEVQSNASCPGPFAECFSSYARIDSPYRRGPPASPLS